MAALIGAIDLHPPPPGPWTAALDLAEVLVERGVPFRAAHRVVGRVVAAVEGEGRDPDSVTDADLRAIDPRFRDGDSAVLDPAASVAERRSPGGGSFASVAVQIERIRRLL